MYDLKKLKEAANAACRKAYERHTGFDGEAINWGNLGCVSAEYCVDDNGNKYHRVVIDEAAPDCPKFREFVCGFLHEAEFLDVEVITEW